MQKVFVFNSNLCIGCRNCATACKQKNGLKFSLRTVSPILIADAPTMQYVSMGCNHCENPECFRVCPNRAYSRGENGVVLHDASRCDGCNECIKACPFNGPRYNVVTGKIAKCNFCSDLLARGEVTACSASCPTQALTVLDSCDDFIEKNATKIRNAITKPRYYVIPTIVGKQFFIHSTGDHDGKA